MTFVQWITQRLSERFVSIIGGLFAAHLETTAALEEAECQDLLEKRARQFEDEGKLELAANLRQKAARITSQAPGDGAVAAVKYLHETDLSTTAALPAPNLSASSTDEPDDTGKDQTKCQVPRSTRRRPARTKGTN